MPGLLAGLLFCGHSYGGTYPSWWLGLFRDALGVLGTIAVRPVHAIRHRPVVFVGRPFIPNHAFFLHIQLTLLLQLFLLLD
jgi:hypothetical protein